MASLRTFVVIARHLERIANVCAKIIVQLGDSLALTELSAQLDHPSMRPMGATKSGAHGNSLSSRVNGDGLVWSFSRRTRPTKGDH